MGKKQTDSHFGSIAAAPASYPHALAKPNGKSAHILIVDDQAAMRKALRQLFAGEAGLEVCGEAQDGREAIEMAVRLKPDLITLDLSMPVMNGLEAARELRRALPTAHLVMVTAHSTPHLEHEVRRAGVNAVIEKSALGTLLACLRRLLKSHS
jgi:DNA-binding NarL/FixJ family response regulator